MAPYHDVGKASIVKNVEWEKSQLLGDAEACTDKIVNETVTFISPCYRFTTNNMASYRMNSWYQKALKARKSVPLLLILPPTHETFRENVKCAHFR